MDEVQLLDNLMKGKEEFLWRLKALKNVQLIAVLHKYEFDIGSVSQKLMSDKHCSSVVLGPFSNEDFSSAFSKGITKFIGYEKIIKDAIIEALCKISGNHIFFDALAFLNGVKLYVDSNHHNRSVPKNNKLIGEIKDTIISAEEDFELLSAIVELSLSSEFGPNNEGIYSIEELPYKYLYFSPYYLPNCECAIMKSVSIDSYSEQAGDSNALEELEN